MLSVANKPIMLNVVMPGVIMLSVMAPNSWSIKEIIMFLDSFLKLGTSSFHVSRGAMTVCIMTLSVMAFCIATLSIKSTFA